MSTNGATVTIDRPQEEDRGAWLTDLRKQAAEIRETHKYEGKITPELHAALLDLLYVPIPDGYIKFTPPVTGKPYASTGLGSVQPQIDQMNAVLGCHWRALTHFEDAGQTCKAVVVLGNNLAAVSLAPDGGLVIGDTAEVLVIQDGWGSHERGSRGNIMKGATTNALKRVLAACGPGANVYRLDIDPELLGPQEGQSNWTGQRNGGGAPASPGLASEAQRKLIRGRAKDARLTDTDLANIMLVAGGGPGGAPTEPQQATEYCDEVLARLPRHLVDPVLEGIQAAQPGPQAPAPIPASDLAGLPPAPAPLPPAPVSMPPAPVSAPLPAGRDGYAQPDLGALSSIVNPAQQ